MPRVHGSRNHLPCAEASAGRRMNTVDTEFLFVLCVFSVAGGFLTLNHEEHEARDLYWQRMNEKQRMGIILPLNHFA
jgi:hypothetical protein